MVYISNDFLSELLPKWFFVSVGILFIVWIIYKGLKKGIEKIRSK